MEKEIIYLGIPAKVVCDEKCDKALGKNSRPKVQLSADPEDYAYLLDSELGIAPVNPGTYEGEFGKPRLKSDRLNKWCVRECERSVISEKK